MHPDVRNELTTWDRAQGLATDIKAYGTWMRDEAERRIGHLYPDVTGPDSRKLTPIAYIWARTVRSPDPAWDGHVPLVRSWTLRKAKKDRPEVWVEPVIDRAAQIISYTESGVLVLERNSKTRYALGCYTPAAAVGYPHDRWNSEQAAQHVAEAFITEAVQLKEFPEETSSGILAYEQTGSLSVSD